MPSGKHWDCEDETDMEGVSLRVKMMFSHEI